MSVKVYEIALEQAKNDLTWIAREVEILRIRKELLESFMSGLTPLISHLSSFEEPAASSEHAAYEAPAHQEG
jgi:hypothetical protein